MNFICRLGTSSKATLAMIGLAAGLGACTSQDPAGTPGAGGTSGSAGTTGAAGTGAGGSGGGTGYDGVLCLPIGNALITDFTYDPDAGSTTEARWGTYGTTLSGGEARYPDALTSDVTGGEWHIMGTVDNYAGFNVYFDAVNGCNKFDASAYQGISFTISGTFGTGVPATPMVLFGMATVDDNVTPAWLGSVDAGSTMPTPGHCTPTSGNGPYYHPGCADPTHSFALSATPQTISLKWSDFTGGMPTAGVTPTGITSIYWQLPVPTNVGMATVTPYTADLHIDNIKFIAQ